VLAICRFLYEKLTVYEGVYLSQTRAARPIST
jgi:hypothetical protein